MICDQELLSSPYKLTKIYKDDLNKSTKLSFHKTIMQ